MLTYLRSLTFQEIIVLIFLFEGDWSFWMSFMRDFNGVIVILSIICPRTFTRVRKKCDLSEAAFMFFCSNTWWYFSTTVKILSFVCDCKKKSSKYVIALLLSIGGLKTLLVLIVVIVHLAAFDFVHYSYLLLWSIYRFFFWELLELAQYTNYI